MWSNGGVRLLAWLLLVSAALVALGFLLAFLDLVVTGLTTGDVYRYEAMAEALALFLGTGFVTSRSLRAVKHPRPLNR